MYLQYKLDRYNNTITLPFFPKIDVSIKLLLVFTKRYREETNIFEVTSTNFLVDTKTVDNKKIYIYEKEFQIKRTYDLPKDNSLEKIIDEFIKKTKVYPFMLDFEIKFNFASILVYANIESYVFYNKFVCNVSYKENANIQRRYREGILSDSTLFCGPIFKEPENFGEIIENFKVVLIIK